MDDYYVQAPPPDDPGEPPRPTREPRTGPRPELPTTPAVVGMISLLLAGILGSAAGLVWELGEEPALALLLAALTVIAGAGAVLAWMASRRHRPGDRDRLLRRATDATAQVMVVNRGRVLLRLLGFGLPDENDGRILYPPRLSPQALRVLAGVALAVTALSATLVALHVVGRIVLLAGLLPAVATAAIAFIEEERSVREDDPTHAAHEASVAESALRATALLLIVTVVVGGLLGLVDLIEAGLAPDRVMERFVPDV